MGSVGADGHSGRFAHREASSTGREAERAASACCALDSLRICSTARKGRRCPSPSGVGEQEGIAERPPEAHGGGYFGISSGLGSSGCCAPAGGAHQAPPSFLASSGATGSFFE